jgi:hypothetical protein
MATPIGKGKRRTKRTYLGSGAGSLRSGTGATAKAKQQKRKRTLQRLDDITKKLRAVPIPKKAFRPITPKSPATGVDSVFKPLRKNRMPQTIRRQAKR